MANYHFSTDAIKQVGVDHYGEERRDIRAVACQSLALEPGVLPKNPRILELYGSGGNMTSFYRAMTEEPIIVGVDKAPGTNYCMDNGRFVQDVLGDLEPFDILDFDAYGSPNPLIYAAVAVLFYNQFAHPHHKRMIIISTDGLGLAMKLNPRIDWMKHFLIMDSHEVPDLRRPWDHHLQLTEMFFQKLAVTFDWKVTCLKATQAKGKNFVFAAYRFERT